MTYANLRREARLEAMRELALERASEAGRTLVPKLAQRLIEMHQLEPDELLVRLLGWLTVHADIDEHEFKRRLDQRTREKLQI